MKKLILILALAASACGGDDESMRHKDVSWEFKRSPNSGICYEVYSYRQRPVPSYQGYGYMGMSQVDDKYCD